MKCPFLTRKSNNYKHFNLPICHKEELIQFPRDIFQECIGHECAAYDETAMNNCRMLFPNNDKQEARE